MTKFRKSIVIFGCAILCVIGALVAFFVLSATDMIVADPIKITVAVQNDEKEYDGTPLFAASYSITEGELLAGHEAQVAFLGSQTNVGTSDCDASVKIVDKDGRDVTKKYAVRVESGKLDVTARAVKAVQENVTREYTGAPVEGGAYTLAEGFTLCAGHRFAHEEGGSGVTDAGTGEDGSAPRILDAQGNDVTGNYEIEYTPGTITVERRSLRLALRSAEKTYDGTPLTGGEYDIASGTLAPGHSLTLSFGEETQRTHAGVTELRMQGFTVLDGAGRNVSDNYSITGSLATLTVKPRPVYVTGKSGVWEYDGEPHDTNTPDAEDETVTGLMEGDAIAVQYTATIREAGSAPNTFTAEITRDDEDVSDDYELMPVFGTLTVTPQEIRLIPQPFAPVYNGEEIPLTPQDVVGGLTEAQQNVLYVHTYEAVKHAKTYRYEVRLTDTRNYALTGDCTGTFTVTRAALTGITYAGETRKVYDGRPLAFDHGKLSVTGVDGETLYVTGASATTGDADAGGKIITVHSVVLRNAAGEDVTADYAYEPHPFNGNIARRKIVVAGDALVVEAPPTNLSTCTHLANGTTLAAGESYTATVRSTGLTLEVTNVQIVNGKQENYEIETQKGSITYLS